MPHLSDLLTLCAFCAGIVVAVLVSDVVIFLAAALVSGCAAAAYHLARGH